MDMVQQVSVFLENKSGRLAEVTDAIAAASINIGALSVAETSDFGILRFICNQPAKAVQVLRDAGFSVGETEVLAIQLSHRPGGLAEALDVINPLDINIEYLYAFANNPGQDAVVVMRVENACSPQAAEALAQAGFKLLTPEEAYQL